VVLFQALLALYEAGFPVIGQVHSGNTFCSKGRYMLGGYENTVLGYRTSLYAEIKKEGLLDCIDVIMLGKAGLAFCELHFHPLLQVTWCMRFQVAAICLKSVPLEASSLK